MANIQLTHAPILNSSAQLLILPVNSAGILLDPILTRTKTLFPDNYQRYHRACRDGSLCLVAVCYISTNVNKLGLVPVIMAISPVISPT
ncbi:hypothetical protein QL919_07475 [Psychrobacter sp. APC 3426]|uniref:hypothetical protein n=1 Tax=Psychrobacter sp. APC 3426 TaxID=3035177 RepID=UPI0025B2D0E8|nr:hypothetical protein [Psychrobacter sp. APC 3426]MDN3398563.1 hypothetical protein [Psychrobacter sp. APC 3426]